MTTLMTVAGIISVLGLLFLLSDNKKSIKLKTVGIAFGLQVAIAFLLVKFPLGQVALEKVSAGVTKVFSYANSGIGFVFGSLASGESATGFIFGIQVLGVIIFISALTAILHYLGVIGFVIKVLGGAVGKVLGTGKAESFVATANVFLGQTEAPILVGKYMPKMTKSEIMTVLVSGMGSVAGSVLVGYNLLGIPMEYLLIASALVPVGSLLVSKILTPETEVSKIENVVIDRKGSNTNIFSAMSEGINSGLMLALGVGASLIAGISIIALLNGGFGLVGTSIEQILSYVFLPLGLGMGLPYAEALTAGQMLGMKMTVNEFVSFLQLAPMADSLSERAFMMISIALTGFASFTSIAICVTGLAVFAPDRKNDIASLATRGMIGGFMVSVLSAMIVGLFI
jgi:concentrative nucleoside transporter, CNT family